MLTGFIRGPVMGSCVINLRVQKGPYLRTVSFWRQILRVCHRCT